jgi:glycosyltransferase involved in cell wall biosynthesis
VFLIPYLILFSKKKGWFKYAGNWKENPAPLGYAIQRFFLKRQKRKVTINGKWENQKGHCLSFENPCLTEKDIIEGKEFVATKTNKDVLNFCYVGRLEKQKGVERIINAFNQLPHDMLAKVGEIHLVGDGADVDFFKQISKKKGVNFKFHGFLPTHKVFEIYKESHFFLMPSMASEGFPKVIAEAMNYGCVPIVSSISSIGQYVKNGENGFLIDPVTEDNVINVISEAIDLPQNKFEEFQIKNQNIVVKFTYEYYLERIKKLISEE